MIKHIGTVTLETDRLILRKIKITDAEAAYKNWLSVQEVNRYLTWTYHKSIQDTVKSLEKRIKEYEEIDTYCWIIEEKESKEVIGTIEVVDSSDENETCEIGIKLGNKWWGKGYATEAYKKVIKFLINEIGYYLIEAECRKENIGSQKSLLNAGMKYEATLKTRRIDKKNGNRDDIMWYSISKEELKEMETI